MLAFVWIVLCVIFAAIVVARVVFVHVWGWRFQNRGEVLFVLVLSNINIVWQKSLSAPLRTIHTTCFQNICIIMFNNNVFILSMLIKLR